MHPILPDRAHRGRMIKAATAALLLVAATSALAGRPQPVDPAVHPTRVVVVGDSLSTGHGTSPEDAWPALMRKDPLGAGFELFNAAENGSGYLSPGDYDGTFGTQVEDFVTPDTGVVVFFGSENDLGYAAPDIGDAALAAVTRAEELAPAAKIIVVGPPSYTATPDPALVDISTALKSAAREAGGEFVDPIEEGWISDDFDDLIGPDGDHPTVAGQHYLLEHIGARIDQASPAAAGMQGHSQPQ
ncbi:MULTISPECIES: SGNH/GDSL hydrolase family protein [unclassified Arthrobacter]|jgi:lysophospholipase L1-like esterase|uniref:SGNH/GDSL hydrolase family protein n=1 Tax=unclassified Arthrobacter TaxID=235627 RepID=UPI001C854DE4|nr:SGNH/GDSL hydrolase family protein [Arthrobacter sp. MAHUQ-56]MBX7444315.1 SGNH/GDSL hydrolase family protein [Arthrobacter sp. MAHUQ-56]